MPTATIDKISFVAYLAVSEKDLKTYLTLNSEWRQPAKKQYEFTYKLREAGCLQTARAGWNIPPIRYEFNPSNCDKTSAEQVCRLLMDPKPTRIDVAIDYHEDLSNYVWVPIPNHIRNLRFGRSGALETVELGAGSSDLSWRIYDKATEAKEPGLRPFWRVEAQIRRPGEVLLPEDLFANLVASSRKYTGLAINEQALLNLLDDDPTVWGQIDPRTRKRYQGLVVKHDAKPLSPCPQEVYLHERQRLLNELHQWPSIARERG